MPPKFKFTKEEIINCALDIARKDGIKAVTARNLASKLNSSSKPIFGIFKNMKDVQEEVKKSANELYKSYINKEIQKGKYPPYKASGMAYILFAKEEKELFKLLFMRDRTKEDIKDEKEEIKPIIDIIMSTLKISQKKALELHLQLWIYVHGIASMIATNYLEWDINFISDTLTNAYEGFKKQFSEVEK